jgi:hypothetical protein
VALANPMATQHWRDVKAIGNAWSEARVWAPVIVMPDRFAEDAAELLPRIIQPTPNRTDHLFAESVWASVIASSPTPVWRDWTGATRSPTINADLFSCVSIGQWRASGCLQLTPAHDGGSTDPEQLDGRYAPAIPIAA